MHTAKHWRGIALFGLGKAHRTLAHRTRVWLRVSDLKAGGQHQGVRVVCVALDQQVDVPFAVYEKMLSPVQIQTQSSCHLLYGTLHQLLHLFLSHGAAHGEQHSLQDAILHVLWGDYNTSQTAARKIYIRSYYKDTAYERFDIWGQ